MLKRIGLVVFLLGLVGAVAVNPASPPVPIKDQAITANDNSTTGPHLGEESSDVAPFLQKPEIQPNSATERKENQGDAQEDRWNLTKIVGLANVGLFLLGLYGMHLVRQQLLATETSNKHTAESNEIARTSLELGHRAWLLPTAFSRESPHSLGMVIKNTGGVPATDVKISCKCSLLVADGETISIPVKNGVVQFIGGGEPFHSVTEIAIPSDEGLRRILGGQDKLVVEIEITYRDIFCRPRSDVAGDPGDAAGLNQTRVTNFYCTWAGDQWTSIEGKLL